MAHTAKKWAVKRSMFGEMTELRDSYIQLCELVNSRIVNAIQHNSSPQPETTVCG